MHSFQFLDERHRALKIQQSNCNLESISSGPSERKVNWSIAQQDMADTASQNGAPFVKENKSLGTVNTAARALVEALLCLPEGVATSGASGPEVVLLLA